MKPFNKKGIDQGKIFNEGNEYVRREFPKIDFIESCEMIEVSDETYLKEKIEQNQLKNLIPFSGDDKVNHVPDEAVILQKEVVKVEEEAKPIEEITIEVTSSVLVPGISYYIYRSVDFRVQGLQPI